MTVTYTDEIATARGLTLFKLLFFKWKGSVFRLIWKDLLVFLAIFYLIKIVYLCVLDDTQKKYFEALILYANTYQNIVPLSFVLGFFVSNVMSRWWRQFESIPWPTSTAVYVSTTLHGYDEVGRCMRRTILRYVNLSLVMVFRILSSRVKKRFPRMDDLIQAGFINESELSVLKDIEKKYPGYSKNWLPICWAASLAIRAREDGRIKDDFALKTIIEELNKFRASCGILMNYATICIPLVYVQVVTIAVYSYFLTAIIARQPLLNSESNYKNPILFQLDNLPLLITLQFIFYMGWIKVAETMINPFGEDDDDFEVNSMIDRNFIMSYLIVDDMHNDHPELLKDQYWDELPKSLPDRGKPPKTNGESKQLTDFFDVQSEEECLLIDMNDPIVSTVNSKVDLKPRSSVIDENYRKVSNVEVTQSILEKQMQQAREKAFLIRDIESDSSSEDDDESMEVPINMNDDE